MLSDYYVKGHNGVFSAHLTKNVFNKVTLKLGVALFVLRNHS